MTAAIETTPLFIATATTNTRTDSLVQVQVEDIVCALTVETNAFGDNLPVIPTASRIEDNQVLYQIKLKALLVNHADGRTVENHALRIKSNRASDTLRLERVSDQDGHLTITVESRLPGALELVAEAEGVTSAPLKLNFKEAWYQSTFLMTGYNVCSESDFSGPLVDGAGLDEKHKEDFLFGASGVPMQGTGREAGGRYVRLQSMQGGWHHNPRGNRDRVNEPAHVSFRYADGVVGAYGNVTENHSIAVDPHVIPRRGRVHIDGIGNRTADDTGSAIRNYHIDNFLGAGQAVVTSWLASGLNGTQRRVKYLGA